jgi:hypothetical protein
MAQNKMVVIGPLALTNTYTTNIFNPGTVTGGVNQGTPNCYFLCKKITVTNKTGGAVTYRLYRDATGGNTAGKELRYDKSVAANSSDEIFTPGLRFSPSDFLVGGASASTSLTIFLEGEIGIE